MNNYAKYTEIMSNIGILNLKYIVRALKNNCIFEDELIEMLDNILKTLRTDKKCPRCGKPLYLSDVEGYEYVCPYCDENFYSMEVE